jgi:hypothetical protein
VGHYSSVCITLTFVLVIKTSLHPWWCPLYDGNHKCTGSVTSYWTRPPVVYLSYTCRIPLSYIYVSYTCRIPVVYTVTYCIPIVYLRIRFTGVVYPHEYKWVRYPLARLYTGVHECIPTYCVPIVHLLYTCCIPSVYRYLLYTCCIPTVYLLNIVWCIHTSVREYVILCPGCTPVYMSVYRPTVYLLYTCGTPVVYLVYTDTYWIPVVYLSYTCRIPTVIVYLLYTYCIPIVYLLYTYCIPVVYLSYTYRIPVVYLSYTYYNDMVVGLVIRFTYIWLTLQTRPSLLPGQSWLSQSLTWRPHHVWPWITIKYSLS